MNQEPGSRKQEPETETRNQEPGNRNQEKGTRKRNQEPGTTKQEPGRRTKEIKGTIAKNKLETILKQSKED